jgi:predicted GNAT family N-acyltransferase
VHARGFYERAGFQPFGEVYLEAGIEHIGMRRGLTA